VEKMLHNSKRYPSFALEMEIGIISDTHSYLDDRILHHLKECNLIIHAGDVGDYTVIERLKALAPVECVYGNIDNSSIRGEFPEWKLLDLEGVSVLVIHIAGAVGKYNQKVRKLLVEHKPKVLICGHSHILKVIRDDLFHVIHINSGAAGRHGFHKMRTLIRVSAAEGSLKNLRIVELGPRSTQSID